MSCCARPTNEDCIALHKHAYKHAHTSVSATHPPHSQLRAAHTALPIHLQLPHHLADRIMAAVATMTSTEPPSDPVEAAHKGHGRLSFSASQQTHADLSASGKVAPKAKVVPHYEPKEIECWGHRGASAHLPENTYAPCSLFPFMAWPCHLVACGLLSRHSASACADNTAWRASAPPSRKAPTPSSRTCTPPRTGSCSCSTTRPWTGLQPARD